MLTQQLQRPRQKKRSTVSLGRVCIFTHRLCFWRSQEFPDRLRLTRALSRSRGLEQMCKCGSVFTCECIYLARSQAEQKAAMKEELQEAHSTQPWKQSSRVMRKASLLQEKSSSQQTSVCKPYFEGKGCVSRGNDSSVQRPETPQAETSTAPGIGQP